MQCSAKGSPRPARPFYAKAGEELIVEQISGGRFLYVAIRGGSKFPSCSAADRPTWPGRFGGYHGRMLRESDSLSVGGDSSHLPTDGFHCAAELLPRYEPGIVHVTRGTQADLFDEAAWRALTETEYRVTAASDRTGYRLEGAVLANPAGTLPSEASCPGAIQIPGDGLPIVLMADAPTVGGYPKIAVVAEADLPIIAQRSPGRDHPVRADHDRAEPARAAATSRGSPTPSAAQLVERFSELCAVQSARF